MREYDAAALVESDEASGDGAAMLFARRLASLSVAACVYLLVVEAPAELVRVGNFDVPDALRAPLQQRFELRLSTRELAGAVERLEAAGCLHRARACYGEFPPVLVTSSGADASAATVDAAVGALRGGAIDPVPVAAAIAAMWRQGESVIGHGATRLACAVVAALVRAGADGRIDADMIAASGLGEAVEGRRKTLAMRKSGGE